MCRGRSTGVVLLYSVGDRAPGPVRQAERVFLRSRRKRRAEAVPVTGSRDPYFSRFDRMPERLPGPGEKFGEFVEEQHTAKKRGKYGINGKYLPL